MIQLKELRIGNWIKPSENAHEFMPHKYDDKNPVELDFLLMCDFCGTDGEYFNGFDYIELTPKILENFKFRDIQYNYFTDILCRCKFDIRDGVLRFTDYHSNSKCIKIEYIHQLQNLFYSLTGIELNDIVAYNYYLEKAGNDHKFSFDEFIIECDNKYEISINSETYKLGDLPQNLFL